MSTVAAQHVNSKSAKKRPTTSSILVMQSAKKSILFRTRTTRYELEFHRPYIDAVTLVDDKGQTYERIPEVIDCWVESGAMPYAS
jgi:isoleucyl-tRNA synthetase